MGMKPKSRRVAVGEDGKALTDIERSFIDAYLKTLDLYQTMRAIGKAPLGASRGNIVSEGRKIMVRPEVLKEITERFQAGLLDRDGVLYRLSLQARNTYADYLEVQPDGSPKLNLTQMVEDGMGHLVKALKPGRYGLTIEFVDGQKALELLGKHYKLFTEKVEHSGDVNIKVIYADEVEGDPEDG